MLTSQAEIGSGFKHQGVLLIGSGGHHLGKKI